MIFSDDMVPDETDSLNKKNSAVSPQPAATEQLSREQLIRELEETREALERSNRELQEFTSVVSHDLQEPLRAITGFMQLLRNRYSDRLDEKGKDFIERCERAGRRMQQQIADLLALSRVATAGAPFVMTDINTIVAEVLEHCQLSVRHPRARITCGTLPELPVDQVQIRRLFQHLVSNGLTYNTSAEPRLEIDCSRQGDEYLFWVKDNGIGIAPEFHSRIFVVFQRLHSTREYEGNGLGLALCKKIVRRHGGELWVESQPQQGACFYFTLPDAPAA
jgi:light-regulated signal transduction histidine kinase (bacteriophytochrome)